VYINWLCKFYSIYLYRHPEYKERLIKELENIKEDKDFEQSKLNECVFLTAFIKECLRQYPPAPIVFLRVANVDHNLADIKIKAGTVVTVAFNNIQNNPKYFLNIY
jgi:cytochrome P450